MSDILPNSKDFFTHINKDGLMETVDAVSGRVIQVENVVTPEMELGRREGFTKVMHEGQEVLVPTGMNIESYKPSKVKFNKVVADIICDHVAGGEGITKICKRPGYPSYSIVRRWMRENESFAMAINEARRARAECLYDEIMDQVEDVENLSKDELAALKLKIDTMKWGAGVNDGETFGNKKDNNSAQAGAVQIVVNTGIVRDTNFIETDPQVKKIVEEMNQGDEDESKQ